MIMMKGTTAYVNQTYPKYQRIKPNFAFIIPITLIFAASKFLVVTSKRLLTAS